MTRSPSSLLVELSPVEVRFAAHLGRTRLEESSTYPNKHGLESKSADDDIVAAAAEMVVAKLYNVYFLPTVGTFKAPDIGRRTQVRHTKHTEGSLIIREADDDAHNFFLVVGELGSLRVCGWMSGGVARQERWVRRPNGRPPAWFVPQACLRDLGDIAPSAL